MESSYHTPRLHAYQLAAIFDGTTVSHLAQKSNRQPGARNELDTVWIRDKRLGGGGFGVVWREREKTSGQLRAVKIVSKEHVRMLEVAALLELQDAGSYLACIASAWLTLC